MIELALLFFLTALIYSSAGFGGGSTYLALLVIFQVPQTEMRPIALICNLAVVSYGTYAFARNGYLKFRRFWPFLVMSIPMAYAGGTIQLSDYAFKLLLGASLAVAAVRLLWIGKPVEPSGDVSIRTAMLVGLPLGALLGFLAGVVGIGGGIYLAPVLLLLGWTDAKQTAAAASFFILVNSLAGLTGQFTRLDFPPVQTLLPLFLAVIVGGQLGSRMGSGILPKVALQRVTGVLILAVAGRLLWSTL